MQKNQGKEHQLPGWKIEATTEEKFICIPRSEYQRHGLHNSQVHC